VSDTVVMLQLYKLLAVLALAAIVSACGSGPSSSPALPAFAPSGSPGQTALGTASAGAPKCFGGLNYPLTYDDEFTTLNGANYQYAYPWGPYNPSGGDDDYYKPSQVAVTAAGLTLSAVPAPSPFPTDGNGHTFHYFSGMVSTYPHEIPQYGYVEASIAMPAGQGTWPAFWMLDSYGTGAETDIMEHLNGNAWIQQTLHYVGGAGSSEQNTPGTPVTGFHSYGVLWTPLADTFYTDGVAEGTYPSVDLVHGQYIMLAMQIGTPSSWPGAPNATTTWPQTMSVRYLRVYQTASSPCASTVTPASVAGLKLWLDGADPAVRTTSSSGNVTQLLDKSGNNVALQSGSGFEPNPINGPTVTANASNGLSTLRFDGKTEALVSPANPGSTLSAATVLLVFSQDAPAIEGNIFTLAKDGFAGTGINGLNIDTSYGTQSALNAIWLLGATVPLAPNYANWMNGASVPFGTYNLQSYVVPAAGTALSFVNGSPAGSQSVEPGTMSNERYTLGTDWNWGDGNQFFPGHIAEVLVYGSALSTGDRQTLEGYLAWKWGLAASLPATHPYRSVAPGASS
jgi:beta-glucanase (GH16 family)